LRKIVLTHTTWLNWVILTSLGHNLTNSTEPFNAMGDLTNTGPNIGPLGWYGGYVQTIPLLPGSPAINAGEDAARPKYDARGVKRPVSVHCDIGAFEPLPRTTYVPVISR
jgi:hypothetical protein